MAECSVSMRHDGRKEKDKYLCVEGKVGRVRQRHENWEPATEERGE